MSTLWQDIRYALRLMAKNPGYAIVAVLTLALGIGATTAIFSVVNAVLIKPLPYPEPEQLVRVYERTERIPKFPMSPGNFLDYRERNTVFSDLAIYTRQDVDLAEGDRPERLAAMRVSAEFFRLLGFQPALGRDFRRAEEQPSEGRVAIISHSLWQRRFGGDPQTVGRRVNLSGQTFTIVGILPPGVQHVGGDYRTLEHGESVEVWWPVDLSKESAVRFAHYMNAVGRMKAGVTRDAADAEMNLIAGQLAEQFPNTNRSWRTSVSTLYEELVGKSRRMLLVLLGAVALVLLIVCVNVASLCLARASARAHEMAVRAAVGAGRGRMIRQLLTENLLTALLGGALGVLFALWLIDLIVGLGPKDLPRRQMIELDDYMLVFVLGVSLLTGLLFGLVPALHGTRVNLSDMLKDGGRLLGGGRRQQRLRSALVVVELALALVLLVGAGLLGRSFISLQRVESGFRPGGVVTMSIAPPFVRYRTPQATTAFYDRLLERLQTLPGVASVGATSDLPWTGYDENTSFNIEGKTFPQDEGPGARYHFASPDYFRTIGTPLVAGRFFDARDREGAPPVVLINESAARRYWPGESAVGRRITFMNNPKKDGDWLTVAGVIGDVKDTPGAETAAPALYWPLAQQPQREMILALRSTTDQAGRTESAAGLVESVRREVAALDKELAVADVRRLDEVSGAALARERFALLVIGLFAAAALLLAGIGIYGVMSYLVAQRRHEIGIRMALGAERRDVLRLVLGQGLKVVCAGVAIGLGAALGLARLMTGLLYGTSAYDPLSFGGVVVLLAGVALLACYLPARRAMRVDPMVALRYE